MCSTGTVTERIRIGSLAARQWVYVIAVVGVLLSTIVGARAQTTLLFEGFEGNFPVDNGWSVGDANTNNGLVYWDDVYTAFGSVPAHTGYWKGYCAALSNGVPVSTAIYAVNMQAYASKTLNLAGYTGANLSFWYNIPSIETYYDHFKVYMDSTVLLDTNGATPGWQFLALPLNAYLGGSHTLKFEFDSDYSVVYEGAYLDDIQVDAANQPVTTSLSSLVNANYSGYVLDSDTTGLGRSNIMANATFNVENFTGSNIGYTNVLSFRLINTNGNAVSPIYDQGNTATNASYTYNITNILFLAAGTNVTVTNTAFIRPAARMSQFTQYYLECRMFTNGVLAQALTTAPATYYHFTNTVSGDTAYNVLLNFTNNAWSRTYAITTVPGLSTFQVNVGYQIRRWDDFNAGVSSANIPVIFNYTLYDSGGNAVPLASNSQVFYDTVPNYVFLFPYAYPAYQNGGHTLDIQPAGQLDSVNKTYYLTVTLAHTNDPVSGQVVAANTLSTPTTELLHFDGNLYFGAIGTTMNSLGAPAPPTNSPSGGVIPTTLTGVGGFVTGKPDHTYSGATLNVNLQPNGDAVVTAGSVVLTAPSPDSDSIAEVNFARGPVTLSSSGANGNLTVTLPTGFGYRVGDISNLVVSAFLPFSAVNLTQALAPNSDLTYLPGSTIYAMEEDKPVWLVSDRILWHVNLGTFDVPPTVNPIYVRANEFAYLQSVSNVLADPPNMGNKRANDKYWLALNTTVGTPSVRPDAGGNSLLTATFSYTSGGFHAHFPYDAAIQWTGAGQMKVVNDLVVVGGSSVLNGATTVGVPYTRDCTDCGGGASGYGTPTITAASSLFNFTLDGGLVAVGPTTSTVDLQWGFIGSPVFDFAQQAFGFNNGVFHMPGLFLRGDQNLLPAAQGATTILYTGFAGTNLNYAERPLSAGYAAGYADYAGMNFRCDADGAHAARSTIASQTGINWSLTGRSKYYVRYGGVSGIHEAVPGSFPATLVLWGYKFSFSNYGLSYMDSRNDQPPTTSLVNGLVVVPYPSDFVQAFNHMRFSCLGAPESGEVPPGDGFKVMSYWGADFKTHSITFKSNNSCLPTAGYLVLGIEGYASHVNKPLYGEVGFFASGDQIPASFGLNGVTSRLKLPNIIKLDGPTNSVYTFTPAEDGFYNTWSNRDSGSSAPGWMNIFGKMDVPFFEDLQLHLQTSCRTNGAAASNAVINLSGGWPRVGSSDPNHGWEISGRTPFETNLFDAFNAGWPGSGGGLTIDKYRNNTTAEDYHPRAQRLWLGVIEFDYPLAWNFSLRTFKSWEGITNDLLIVKIEHQVTYMDPRYCSLDFGAQYSGLPKISLANLAFNAIDEVTGVGDAITKAATKPIEDALSTGLDQMDQLLDTQMKRLMDGVFDKTVDPLIDQYYNTLSNQWASQWATLTLAQRQQFIQGVYSNGLNYFVGNGITPIPGNLTKVLSQLGNGVNAANNLIGQVQGYLRNGTNAINSIIGVVSIGTNGDNLGSNVVGLITQQLGSRAGVPKLATSLIDDIVPEFIDATVGPTLSNLVAQAEPAMSQISQSLGEVENAMILVSTQLNNAGDFTAELSNILASANGALSNATMQVTLATTQYFGNLNLNVDNPFQAVSATDVKHFIRQKVEDQFFSCDATAQIQTAMRQRLYDLDASMRQEIDSVFQQVNGMMRDLISQSLSSLDDSINGCLGSVNNVMGAAKLQGHADIDGDSLKLLRIDGHFQFKVPDNMELDAFLQIKELSSDGSGNGCGDANAPFTEVTVGAEKVPLNWISSGLTADLEAKFTFNGVVPFPIDLGGQIALNGDINFQAFDLHDLAVAMAFGATDNYVALKGGVRFNGFDFSGAAFFGRTCTLDPLLLIDPDVAKVLGNPPFTGGYVYAQGWLPVSQMVTGIPASCLFDISAGVGAGAFYFAEGPTFGGKMFLGVSGQLLCIVSIEGDVTMIGLDKGGKVSFTGKGHFEASLGPCPFCISVSKDVSISYIDSSWSIN